MEFTAVYLCDVKSYLQNLLALASIQNEIITNILQLKILFGNHHNFLPRKCRNDLKKQTLTVIWQTKKFQSIYLPLLRMSKQQLASWAIFGNVIGCFKLLFWVGYFCVLNLHLCSFINCFQWMFFLFFFFVFLSEFSFMDTDNSVQQRKGGDHLSFHSTSSTCFQTFRHLFATLLVITFF